MVIFSAIPMFPLCVTYILDFIFTPISHQHNCNVMYEEMLVILMHEKSGVYLQWND